MYFKNLIAAYRFLFLGLFLAGCGVSSLAFWDKKEQQQTPVLEEIKGEVSDIKHALHASQVEMNLLEEKIEQQTNASASFLEERVASLEKKIYALEKQNSSNTNELKKIQTGTFQGVQIVEKKLQRLERSLEELEKIKASLASLSQYIGQNSVKKKIAYIVRDKDSLGKIAKQHEVSVEELRRINDLATDQIYIGQTLLIPDTSPQ